MNKLRSPSKWIHCTGFTLSDVRTVHNLNNNIPDVKHLNYFRQLFNIAANMQSLNINLHKQLVTCNFHFPRTMRATLMIFLGGRRNRRPRLEHCDISDIILGGLQIASPFLIKINGGTHCKFLHHFFRVRPINHHLFSRGHARVESNHLAVQLSQLCGYSPDGCASETATICKKGVVSLTDQLSPAPFCINRN